jgi:hypothetical protein
MIPDLTASCSTSGITCRKPCACSSVHKQIGEAVCHYLQTHAVDWVDWPDRHV